VYAGSSKNRGRGAFRIWEEKGASVFQTGKQDEMSMEVEIQIMRTQRE
jgi:hypothetical protein